jgi:Chaperone of endosialidase
MRPARLKLRPVSFRYKKEIDPKQELQYGLVAEEVAEVDKELVVYKDGRPDAVRYQLIAPLLISELKKQERQIADQSAELEAQRKQATERDALIKRLSQRLDALERAGQTGR